MSKDRDVKVRILVGSERHEFSVQEELRIDRDDLDSELARQAAHYAWFSILYERARGERVALEGELTEVEARLDQEIRLKGPEKRPLDPESKGLDKKPTEAAIKMAVRTDPRFSETMHRLQRAEQDERLLGAIESALVQRKDMLVALARSRHHEMNAPSADEVDRMKRNLLGR